MVASVDVALEQWITAIARGEVDCLDAILTDDFRLTCDPQIAGGLMDKTQFIAFDRHISKATIDILSLTARRYQDTVITQIFARVDEEFDGDPAGTSAEVLHGIVGGRTLAYASGWRPSIDGGWLCFQHHLFGPVD
jgi:ketosteroid isomerase-like protein